MKIKALITTLAILGTSSVAMARPATTVSASAEASFSFGYGTHGPVVRDHRTSDTYRDYRGEGYRAPVVIPPRRVKHTRWDNRLVFQPQPMMLAESLKFAASDDRKFITVGRTKGLFTQVRIEAAGGRTMLSQVLVEYTDGQSQIIRGIDRVLMGNQQYILNLDGNGKAINRIVVYGKDAGNWGYTPSAFHVTAL